MMVVLDWLSTTYQVATRVGRFVSFHSGRLDDIDSIVMRRRCRILASGSGVQRRASTAEFAVPEQTRAAVKTRQSRAVRRLAVEA